MKWLSAVLALAVASQCLALPAPINDDYADLIQAVLDYARQQMVAHDPLVLPDVKDEEIKYGDIVDLILSQSNTKLSKASTFTVDKIATDPSSLSAEVDLTIPELLQSGDYEVSGKALGKAVEGVGSFKVTLTKLQQILTVTFINPESSLQVSNLGLKYNLEDLDINITGLTIEGMTQEQVQAFMKKEFTTYILLNKDKVAEATAEALKAQINPLIAGKTLEEVVAWVKSQIHQ